MSGKSHTRLFGCTNLPGHETDSFDDGWLYDLFTREDTPGHSVWPVRMVVGPEVTALIDHVVRDIWVKLDLWDQGSQELW